MKVIVQLQKALAAEMRKTNPSPSVAGVVEDAIKEFNLKFEPLHPTVRDEVLQTYFVIVAPDMKTSDQVAERLRSCSGVESAYVKPHSEEPA